jgi:uridine monophosphate synthetase
MASNDFRSKLEARVKAINSLLCVGIDPHRSELFPNNNNNDNNIDDICDAAFTFSKNLIEATLDFAACYKPNAAFFEALGNNGMMTLRRVLEIIPSDIPILLDVKRGDIGTTAMAYAEACYDHLQADAVTLSPLMGWDSVQPFVAGTKNKTEKTTLLMCSDSSLTHLQFLILKNGLNRKICSERSISSL